MHVCGESWCRRRGLSNHDLLLKHHLAAVVDAGELLGDAVPNVELAEVLRHPAPALHVDENALPLFVVAAASGALVQGSAEFAVDNACNFEAVFFLIALHRFEQDRVVRRLAHAPLRLNGQTLAYQGNLRMFVAGL